MYEYKNSVTGKVIRVPSPVRGEKWVEVKPEPAIEKAETAEPKPKKKTTKKKTTAKKGD